MAQHVFRSPFLTVQEVEAAMARGVVNQHKQCLVFWIGCTICKRPVTTHMSRRGRKILKGASLQALASV